MAAEEKYIELFYLATFTDNNEIFLLPHKEIDNPEMAECCIPYKKDGVLYGITFYVTNYPNSHLLILEMLLLKNFVNDVLSEGLHENQNPES